MLMAHHGVQASKVLASTHLHCTLVADILLSAGGPLPKNYQHVHSLARILDDAVKNGVFSDADLIKVQATLKLIYAAEQSEEEKKNEDGIGKENQMSLFFVFFVFICFELLVASTRNPGFVIIPRRSNHIHRGQQNRKMAPNWP